MIFWSSWGGFGGGRRTEITETTADPYADPRYQQPVGTRTVRDERRW